MYGTAIRAVESARDHRRLAINLVHKRWPGAKIPLARDRPQCGSKLIPDLCGGLYGFHARFIQRITPTRGSSAYNVAVVFAHRVLVELSVLDYGLWQLLTADCSSLY